MPSQSLAATARMYVPFAGGVQLVVKPVLLITPLAKVFE